MRYLIYISIILVFLAACSSHRTSAPIVDADAIPERRLSSHVVSPGETLYSIAWRYDLDYKSLAKINGLGGNYGIWPGQKLSLNGAVKKGEIPGPVATTSEHKNTWQKVKTYVSDQLKNSPIKEEAAPVKPASSKSISWQWPLAGDVVEKFQANAGLNKGIDIRGKLGEPVLAAADGEIVYSGSGLRGYGKLLIVKHDEKYLSAYAHNRVLHVAEGDTVKAGEKIAEVGFSGTDTAKLHFEIRFDGQPVDPLKYLPSR